MTRERGFAGETEVVDLKTRRLPRAAWAASGIAVRSGELSAAEPGRRGKGEVERFAA